MNTAAYSLPVLPENTDYDTGDEYYYGYRTDIRYDENGNALFSYRPLTPEDFLEPEEGDVYMQGNLHVNEVIRLRSIFRHYLKNRENVTVYCDMKIEWGIDGLPNPAPDISIIKDVKEPEKPRGTFYVPEEGVKPFFILEVVSPRYRSADIDKKPEIYRKAGVSEYIIADPGLRDNKISYTVYGYRLIGNRYVKIHPDSRGRIYCQTLDVRIGPSEFKDRLIVYDGQTDEEILSDEERAAAESKARMLAEIKAEQEKKRADSAEEELRQLKAKLEALGIHT